MSNEKLKKINIFTYCVLFLALSIILSYVEFLIPLTQFGIKVGLANIITLISLKILDIKKTLLINILRIVIIGILFSDVMRFFISISGFFMSFIITLIFMFILKFSLITTSIFASCGHILGQFICIYIIFNNVKLFYLLPIYMIIAIISGFVIGFISIILYKSLNKFSYNI